MITTLSNLWKDPAISQATSSLANNPNADTLQKAFTLLQKKDNASLRNAVTTALQSQDDTGLLSSALVDPSTTTMQQFIRTAEKIVSLDHLKKWTKVGDASALAKEEAFLLPPKVYNSIMQIPSFLTASWYEQLGTANKAFNYLALTLAWSYSININKPPQNQWEAQGQLSFLRSVLSDSSFALTQAHKYLQSSWKVSLLALGILGITLAAYRLYKYFHIGVPELNPKFFRNLTSLANQGYFQKAIGRDAIVRDIISCLSPPPGQDPRIVFLVAEPGVGKTQLMESLAMTLLEESSHLQGKKIYAVNAAHFQDIGSWDEDGYVSRIDLLFNQIQGFEQDIILFIDEAHSLANQGSSSSFQSNLLEQLKTKLIERKILCVLATTTEEYESSIRANSAFVERIKKIDLPSLNKEDTITVLQQRPKGAIFVHKESYETILEIADKHPEYKERKNPRKSIQILQEALNYVHSWTPAKLSLEIENRSKKITHMQMQLYAESRSDANWITSEKGKKTMGGLNKLREQLKGLEGKRSIQTASYAYIIGLRTLLATYTHQVEDVTRKIASAQPSAPWEKEALEKKYLLYKYVVIPTLQGTLASKVKQFSKDFEDLPTEVNSKLLQKLYPISSSPAQSHFDPPE